MQVAVALELTMRCKACGEPIALNAVTDSVTCGACQRVSSLGLGAWSLLLADPIAHAATIRDGDELETALDLPDGRFGRVFRRMPPGCARCGVALADADVTSGLAHGKASCRACSADVVVRAVEGLGPPGTFFIGEQPELAPGEVATPTAWICERCGGPLDDPGHGRPIACRYCKTFHTLPDARGAGDPARAVRRFFVVVETSAPGARDAPMVLGEVEDVVCDADGHFVVSGDVLLDGRFAPALVSLDAALRLRWIHRGLRPRRVWVADGTVLVEPPRFGRFDARSGVALSGGPPLEQALVGVTACAIASSPPSIVAVRHGLVTRLSLDGGERALFDAPVEPSEPAPEPGLLGKLFGWGTTPVPEDEESATGELRPDHVALLCPLPGGGLVAIAKFDFRLGMEARAFGADGAHAWTVPLAGFRAGPSDRLVPAPGGAFLCTAGQVLWLRAGGESVIVGPKILRDGGVPRIAVAPDGSLHLFHGRGCVRAIAVDGTVLRSNAAALEADRRA